MSEDFDKYLANNKTYISDFDITKHIVLDNESNYWYSAEYVDKMLKKQDKEIERLNNIINDLLDRQNEALRYIGNHLSLDSRYKHGNGDEELILVRKILNKHIKELEQGSDKE